MPPSKKEKDLNSVVKRARELRKDARTAAIKDAKAKQQAIKKERGDESKGTSKADRIHVPIIHRRQRKAVIVTSEEAAEVAQRLEEGDAGAPGSKPSSKKSKNASTKNVVSAASGAGGPLKPNFHVEVHLKNSTISVSVTLHKIPEKNIFVGETTDSRFVLDTRYDHSQQGIMGKGSKNKTANSTKTAASSGSGFVKYYRLEYEFEHGMLVRSKDAEYTLEAGVLKAVFPVSHMPEKVVEAVTAQLESVRRSQRTKTKIKQSSGLQLTAKSIKLGDEADQQLTVSEKKDVSSQLQSNTKKQQPKKQAKVKKVKSTARDSEQKAMLTLAQTASAKAEVSLKQRLSAARELQEKRAKKDVVKENRKEVKQQRKLSAFERVLAVRQERIDALAAQKKQVIDANMARKRVGTGATKKVKFQ